MFGLMDLPYWWPRAGVTGVSEKSSIEWTEATWNPLRGQNARHTCARISPGCDNCYAATMTRRGLMGTAPIDYGRGETPNDPARLDEAALLQPLKWKKPRHIFVCSMTDLFGAWVPDKWIDRMFAVMALTPHHTYQVLTKRPTRMRDYLNARTGEFGYGPRSRIWWAARPFSEGVLHKDAYDALPVGKPGYGPEGVYLRDWPLPNVWIGTSIESDAYAWRANVIREIPAAVRWISAEPLLGGLPSLNLDGIDWLVAGGESGPGARPSHPDWYRDLRDRCELAGTAFFFKQWGAHAPEAVAHSVTGASNALYLSPDATTRPARYGARPAGAVTVQRLGKHLTGRRLDGREWNDMPAAALHGAERGGA